MSFEADHRGRQAAGGGDRQFALVSVALGHQGQLTAPRLRDRGVCNGRAHPGHHRHAVVSTTLRLVRLLALECTQFAAVQPRLPLGVVHTTGGGV